VQERNQLIAVLDSKLLRYADGNLLTFLQDMSPPAHLLRVTNDVPGDPGTEPSQHDF